MKNVRLKALKLRNFKGIKELDVDFNLLDTNIYGKNGTGKTTISDSFMWLLFNKDSSGASDFDVKTKDSHGEYLHYLEHSVEGIFEVNGSELSLKKVMKEKYTQKRGSSTEEFTGHTTDYFVDEIPKKKSEFDSMVNEVVDKDIFQLITDPLYFNDDKRFKWKERRKLLIDICGDVSDEDVFASSEKLKPLEAELNGKSVDDFREMMKSKMKPINDELKAIPIKINEANLAIPETVEQVDEGKLNELKVLIEAKEKERSNIMNGGLIAEKEVELIKFKNRKLLIMNEIPGTKKLADKKYQIELKRNELRSEYSNIKSEIDVKQNEMELNIKKRDALRNEYTEVNVSNYDESKNICPTCNQSLPQEQIDGFVEKFNLDKATKLESLNAEGIKLKEEYTKAETEIKELQKKLDEVETKGKEINAELEEVSKEIVKIEEGFKADKEKRASVVDIDIQRVESEIATIKVGNQELISKIDAQIGALKEEKQKYDSLVANALLAEKQKERINELSEQEKSLSKEYQRMDQLLYLSDLFVKAKVSMLSEKINSHFKLCNFKLFEEQINGGLNECCEVTVNGVPFSDLNTASKVNAGLDCINTICKFTNSFAPVFLDNAESVNNTLKTESQQIRLYVTAHDEVLRIENE